MRGGGEMFESLKARRETKAKCREALEQALEAVQEVQKEMVQSVVGGHFVSEQVCDCVKTTIAVVKALRTL
jgi:hypothetical protein